ncbi:MAG: FKBP-type peptidyl-prolyl cis-trans isomerase [Verrucomicrobiota bacterium]
MKIILAALAFVSFLITASRAEDPIVLKTQKEKVSYSLGLEMGNGMKQQKLDIDPNILVAGFRAGFAGDKALLTSAEQKQVVDAFEAELQTRMEKETKELPEKNKKEGESFLAANQKKEGVTTLPSGLQYQVIQEGKGESPKLTDRVTTHYRGTLLNGIEFDSSYSRNEPSSFTLKQVIKGWQEALQLMKPGAKWQLFIPSNLAYGEAGVGRMIGPNAALIFEIELVSIDKR